MRTILAFITLTLLVSKAAALTPPSFMVFFSPNSPAITPLGDKAIEWAASAYQQRGIQARIVVSAHTDGAEAQSSRIDLSPERGSAVKRRLIALGVPADKIEVEAYTDSRPLARVMPGTAEPQNRRVEIVFY